MAYTPTDWVNTVTPVDELRMDHIEQGIVDAHALLPPPPVGHNGEFLSVAGGAMVWAPIPQAGIPLTLLDAKGDIIAASGPDTAVRVPAGANGTALFADSAVAAGVRWAAVPSGVDYENVWAAGTAYLPGDVVTYQGVTYMAVNPSTGSTPPAVAAPAMGVIPLVTTLPASPFDGQEVVLTDSLTAPTYTWRLRYNAGSTSAYKWEFVGGARKFVEIITLETTTSTTYTDLTTVGPAFTVPRAGDYDYEISMQANFTPAGAASLMAVRVGAAATLDDDAVSSGGVSGVYNVATKVRRLSAVAAATQLKCEYRVGIAGTGNFLRRVLMVWPARVS